MNPEFARIVAGMNNRSLNLLRRDKLARMNWRKVLTQIKVSGEGKTSRLPYRDKWRGRQYLPGAESKANLALRPLCVHFDNGWNSELAVNNIENIITKLGFDLHTFVVDWEEFQVIYNLHFFKGIGC